MKRLQQLRGELAVSAGQTIKNTEPAMASHKDLTGQQELENRSWKTGRELENRSWKTNPESWSKKNTRARARNFYIKIAKLLH